MILKRVGGLQLKTIVVSAVNLREGGPLSILVSLADYLATLSREKNIEIVLLVHSKKVIPIKHRKKFTIIEFPKSVRSYIYRLFYEYYFFYSISKKLSPDLWLSLHDITPRVKAKVRAVYCHNPSPFYKPKLKEFFLDPKFFLFTKFYAFLYAINIKNNNYVIVQQDWLRNEFSNKYSLDLNDIIVAYPEAEVTLTDEKINQKSSKEKTFFYPAFPRVFKNFELICEAIKLINKLELDVEYNVVLTISGTENSYSRDILRRYKDIPNIKFTGLLSREEVERHYQQSCCLLFPSKLETWGLPLSEAKNLNLPIIAANLPYAYETVGGYSNVKFIDPDSPNELAESMLDIISDKRLGKTDYKKPLQPFCSDWDSLLQALLRDD